MSDISLRITESLDLDKILKEIVDGARSLTGTPGVALGLFPSGCSPDDKRAGGCCGAGSMASGRLPPSYIGTSQRNIRST